MVEETRPENGDEPWVAFTMVFRLPPGGGTPRSLRYLLLNGPSPVSLSTRFDIARELAKSVTYVHSFGFVHKNIRPEAILNIGYTLAGHHAMYLLGFEDFRHEDGWTKRRGDDAVEKNLYRHPSRQGSSPREDYVMQHDIYSLGVCLLEVGLWQSFVEYPDQSRGCSLSPLLGLAVDLTDVVQVLRFLETEGKDYLVHLAASQLPQVMGTKYTEFVQTCLKSLDLGNTDFGDQSEFEDSDGVRVGVRYIEKVRVTINPPRRLSY